MTMEEEILNRIQALPERRNPFDEGIAKAISSTRSNLGMSRDQEHRAINNALLALGNGLAKEPIQRGFKNNLGIIGRAMNPALSAYNTSEDTAIAENERLANQILQHQRAEQALVDKREENAWNRKFKERALEEKKRYNNQSLLAKFAKATEKKETPFDKKHKLGLEGLKHTIDDAVTTINKNQALAKATGEDSKGEAGLIKRFSKGIGLTQLTPEQEEIETLGSLLAGYSNKLMNYTNQVEFESLPHISPYKSDANNLAILQKMQKIMLRDAEEAGLNSGETNKNDAPKVRLYDPNTNQYFGVPTDEVELAIKDHPHLIRK